MLPGEGRRVAKASQGGPPTLAAQRKVRSEAEAWQRSEGWGMTCLREEAAPSLESARRRVVCRDQVFSPTLSVTQ
jgi:hypothetical protein